MRGQGGQSLGSSDAHLITGWHEAKVCILVLHAVHAVVRYIKGGILVAQGERESAHERERWQLSVEVVVMEVIGGEGGRSDTLMGFPPDFHSDCFL